MVIQKTKKISFFFNHICIIITLIYLSKSIIKSCINEPVEHFDPVLSLNCEFPVSKTEEENVPNEISRLLGHLSRRSCKYKYQEMYYMIHSTPGAKECLITKEGSSPWIPRKLSCAQV